MTESQPERTLKETEWWETDDGHLFLRHVNLQVKDDATVCLRCYKQFEDCYEDVPCEGATLDGNKLSREGGLFRGCPLVL